MEKDDEFLYTFFTCTSTLCFDKAKEHLEKEKDATKSNQASHWGAFLNFLQQLVLAEKSYIEIGFLQNKNKGFLRKDNSLKAVYETMKSDIKRLEENSRSNVPDKRIQNYCQNMHQFLYARVKLIEILIINNLLNALVTTLGKIQGAIIVTKSHIFILISLECKRYDKIYQMGINKQLKYLDLLNQIETFIQKQALCFTDISLTPVKAVFNLECEILEQLFKALTELQRLQFLPSLALIHGAHTRLAAWEMKMQNRETWKLGFLKNNPLPTLFQWLQKLKGIILSKFSLYFHTTLAQQTTPSDMRQLCSKLQYDHYQKMVHFQKRYDATYVILLSDNQVSCDTTDYDSFPIIVSYPPRCPPQLETIMRMISDTVAELTIVDKIIYKFSSQEQRTYIITTVEPNIYLVILFESKKTEKDVFIGNFITELCTNLRCTKIFINLKNISK